jgi:putative transposase
LAQPPPFAVESIHYLSPALRRFGCRRIHVMLQRYRIGMNLNENMRVYCEKLQVRLCCGRRCALGASWPMAMTELV